MYGALCACTRIVRMFAIKHHSGSRGLPRFIKGIYWEASLFLRSLFTEGARELIRKPRPLAVNNLAPLVPLRTFSSVQCFIGYYFIFLRSLY